VRRRIYETDHSAEPLSLPEQVPDFKITALSSGRRLSSIRQSPCISKAAAVSFHALINVVLLSGLLTIAVALVLWVVRVRSRRQRRHDLGAVSAQWLMTNRIER
jgi:hypothetical protein